MKKTWESNPPCLSLVSGSRIASISRISNASQPTPSDIIQLDTSITLQVKQVVREWSGYNTPSQTLQLHYLCDMDSNLRDLTPQIVTSENVLFPLAGPDKRFCRPQDSLNVVDPPCPKTGLIGYKSKKKNWNGKEK